MSEDVAADRRAVLKQAAAEHAVKYVESGMVVGLGTGSTAIFATRRIAELLRNGQLRDIVGFATSRATHQEAMRLGISMLADDMPRGIDVTIDGADEVDPRLNLIKGGGGAMLREKLVAQASRREIIVVDDSKLSPVLGSQRAVPVEVLPYGWQAQARFVSSLGAQYTIRKSPDGADYLTDQGNIILDCNFGPIQDPEALSSRLDARAGIMGQGLFVNLADVVVVAGADGIRELTAPRRD
jgi:ribose 5-phosphate isomerase A